MMMSRRSSNAWSCPGGHGWDQHLQLQPFWNTQNLVNDGESIVMDIRRQHSTAIARLVNYYSTLLEYHQSSVSNYRSMSYLGWLEMDDFCCLSFPFMIGLCGIIPQPMSAYFLTTDFPKD